MRIKKTGNKIYGGSMSVAEKKAMDMEIMRQLAEYDRKNSIEIDALVLWVLHEQFGFGEKRLRQFYEAFTPAINDLIKRYELGDADSVWLCTRKLKEFGIDVEEWHNERR